MFRNMATPGLSAARSPVGWAWLRRLCACSSEAEVWLDRVRLAAPLGERRRLLLTREDDEDAQPLVPCELMFCARGYERSLPFRQRERLALDREQAPSL